jgi:hypothetical protein
METATETERKWKLTIHRHGNDTRTQRTQTWNWGTFAKYLLRSNSPYSAILTTSDKSWRNLERGYILAASLHDKKNDMQVLKNSYCPSELLSKQYVGLVGNTVRGLRKAATRCICSNWNLTCHIPNLV